MTDDDEGGSGIATARELVQSATGIVASADHDAVPLRILGGIAIALRCQSAEPPGPLAREYSDIDLITTRRHIKPARAIVEAAGYTAHDRFNAVHGEGRLLFLADEGHHLDVFIDTFRLCHELPLKARISVDAQTIPLADLLLTKLQVARLNPKDVTDATALLLDHELTADDSGINVDYIGQLLRRDWGWWRTVTESLRTVAEHMPRLGLATADIDLAQARLAAILDAAESVPKTVKWRMRARVGESRPWRDEPEEVS